MKDLELPTHLIMNRKTFDFGAEFLQNPIIEDLTQQFLHQAGINHNNDIHNGLERFWAREHSCYIIFAQKKKIKYRDYLPGRFYTYSLVCDLINKFGETPNHRVLEVGCGSAITSHFLSMQGTESVGLDISGCALQFANSLTEEFGSQVELIPGSWENIPISDGTFDTVFSLGALEHIPPKEQLCFVRELSRVSRKNIIILIPNIKSPIYQTMEEKEFATMPIEFVYPEETELYPVDLFKLAMECGLVVKEQSALHLVPPSKIPSRFLDKEASDFFHQITKQADNAWNGDLIDAWSKVESHVLPADKTRWGWFSYIVCEHRS
jgi:ubiquinone/menaquinone biosynthesis C-methylase UbiE